jgi:hypothetical protein
MYYLLIYNEMSNKTRLYFVDTKTKLDKILDMVGDYNSVDDDDNNESDNFEVLDHGEVSDDDDFDYLLNMLKKD